jgi:uncharacterized cofD-like protein
MSKKPKKIVCFGGGSALPKVVLEPLKKRQVEITSVTSMLESGGSTGQLRKDFNILPPGDISRHLVALSNAPHWKRELFLFRFGNEKFPGGHKGHRFGTVFIAGLEYFLKDFKEALKVAHNFLEIKKHKALPATIERVHAWATLENGKSIKGEDEIDVPKLHDGNLKIKEIYLKPLASAYQLVLESIKKADFLIFGPGDLYSSIIPCFLPRGVKGAIKKSKAKKIFLCNLMTKFGETNNFSVMDFTREMESYIGCKLDFVVYNTNIPAKERIRNFKKEDKGALYSVRIDEGLNVDKFIGYDLILRSGPILHDPQKTIKILIKLCKL